MHKYINDQHRAIDIYLYGRRTYEVMVDYWPTADTNPASPKYKDLVLGGANIASTFMRLGLIDEYQLFVQPIVLGSGTPLFPASGDKVNLRLVETRAFHAGVILLRYQRVDEGQARLFHHEESSA